jgi:hypothetical protein
MRMLAWSAELAYRHECLDLVASLLGNDALMDVIDVEGIRWAGGGWGEGRVRAVAAALWWQWQRGPRGRSCPGHGRANGSFAAVRAGSRASRARAAGCPPWLPRGCPLGTCGLSAACCASTSAAKLLPPRAARPRHRAPPHHPRPPSPPALGPRRTNVLANVFTQEPGQFMEALLRMAQEARRPEDLLPMLRTLQHLWLEIKYADEQHSEPIGRLLQVRCRATHAAPAFGPAGPPCCVCWRAPPAPSAAAACAARGGSQARMHPPSPPPAQLTADMWLAHKGWLAPGMDESLRNGLWTLASCACAYSAQPGVVPQLAQLLRGSDARLQARCAELLGSWMQHSALPEHQQEVFDAAVCALGQEGLTLKALDATCSLIKKFPITTGPVGAGAGALPTPLLPPLPPHSAPALTHARPERRPARSRGTVPGLGALRPAAPSHRPPRRTERALTRLGRRAPRPSGRGSSRRRRWWPRSPRCGGSSCGSRLRWRPAAACSRWRRASTCLAAARRRWRRCTMRASSSWWWARCGTATSGGCGCTRWRRTTRVGCSGAPAAGAGRGSWRPGRLAPAARPCACLPTSPRCQLCRPVRGRRASRQGAIQSALPHLCCRRQL